MFEWDERKRLANLRERGVDFAEAALIFENEVIEAIDNREDYGEIRHRALGHVGEDYFLIAYTWRKKTRRIISAWRLDDEGKRRYQETLAQPSTYFIQIFTRYFIAKK